MATQLAEVQADEHEEHEEAQTGPRDFEAEAKLQGWTPKEVFKGDASHWIDAEAFVKRGEELAPFLKKKNHILERELAQIKRDMKREFGRLEERDAAIYSRALADLEARRLEAVESGDVAAFKKIDQDTEKLKGSIDNKSGPLAAEAEEALDAWTDENPWYELGAMASATPEQARARAYADRIAGQNAEKAKGMAPADFYAFISEKVEAKFGESLKAKATRREAVNPVTGGTAPRARGGGRSFSDMPADAQAAAKRYVAKGILKSTDDYVKSYQW